MENNGRKRGGQPGNLNGIKHGFYSKRLKNMALEEAAALHEDLDEEIALLRAMLQKYIASYEAAESIEEMGRVLDVTGMTVVRIASLVRTNFVLRGNTSNDNPTAVIERVLLDLAIQEGL